MSLYIAMKGREITKNLYFSAMQGSIEAQYFSDMQRNIVGHINRKINKYICTIDNLLPYYIYKPLYCSVIQGTI